MCDSRVVLRLDEDLPLLRMKLCKRISGRLHIFTDTTLDYATPFLQLMSNGLERRLYPREEKIVDCWIARTQQAEKRNSDKPGNLKVKFFS